MLCISEGLEHDGEVKTAITRHLSSTPTRIMFLVPPSPMMTPFPPGWVPGTLVGFRLASQPAAAKQKVPAARHAARCRLLMR